MRYLQSIVVRRRSTDAGVITVTRTGTGYDPTFNNIDESAHIVQSVEGDFFLVSEDNTTADHNILKLDATTQDVTAARYYESWNILQMDFVKGVLRCLSVNGLMDFDHTNMNDTRITRYDPTSAFSMQAFDYHTTRDSIFVMGAQGTALIALEIDIDTHEVVQVFQSTDAPTPSFNQVIINGNNMIGLGKHNNNFGIHYVTNVTTLNAISYKSFGRNGYGNINGESTSYIYDGTDYWACGQTQHSTEVDDCFTGLIAKISLDDTNASDTHVLEGDNDNWDGHYSLYIRGATTDGAGNAYLVGERYHNGDTTTEAFIVKIDISGGSPWSLTSQKIISSSLGDLYFQSINYLNEKLYIQGYVDSGTTQKVVALSFLTDFSDGPSSDPEGFTVSDPSTSLYFYRGSGETYREAYGNYTKAKSIISYNNPFSTIVDGAYRYSAYSPNQNRIYFAPHFIADESVWHYIDCTNGNVVAYEHGVSVVDAGYNGCVYSPSQDRIYFTPYAQATQSIWHYIDCATGSVVEYLHGASSLQVNAYGGGAYDPTNDRIYFAPDGQSVSSTWHYIDCATGNVVAYTGATLTTQAYSGCVRSPNQNRIYFVPQSVSDESTWHYIDLSTGNVVGYTHGTGITTDFAYYDGVYDSTNDRIYMVPYFISDETNWHYIDCSDGSVVSYAHGASGVVNRAYSGGVYDSTNDRIYFVPLEQSIETNWHYVDCSTGNITQYTHGTGITTSFAYIGGTYDDNLDRVYFSPYRISDDKVWHYIKSSDGSVNQYSIDVVATAYVGSVYSPNQNRIYLVPWSQATQAQWHYIDCATGNVVAYLHGQSISSTTAYAYGVYSPNQDRIYFAPYGQGTEANWHYIDCTDGSVNSYAHGSSAANGAYINGAHDPVNDRIYFAPYYQGSTNPANWHYIDCTTGNVVEYSATTLQYDLTMGAYGGAAYDSTNSRIYFGPAGQADQATWHYIDLSTGNVVGYAHGSSAVNGAYNGAVLSPNQNRIYFMPFAQGNQANWHYVDLSTGNVVAYAHGAGGVQVNAYDDGIYVAGDSRIYLTPRSQSNQTAWHYIDTINGNVVSYNTGQTIQANGYAGGAYSTVQDKLYFAPFAQSNQANWHYLGSTGTKSPGLFSPSENTITDETNLYTFGTPTPWDNIEAADYGSPGWPGQYPNDQDVTTTITKVGASEIRVRFDAFKTEGDNYDYVQILNSADELQATYQGNLGAFTSTSVAGDTIKLRFVSDGSVPDDGWHVDQVEWNN